MIILKDRELVMHYIENSQECEWVDFKRIFYAKKSVKDDFIKDVVSFANNLQPKDKYIIFGVEDKSHIICGIDENSFPDVADLESLLCQKVEPQINIILDSFSVDNKLIAYIKIPCSNDNLPYVIKNECSNVKQGDIFIRKGSFNSKATRRDLDEIYFDRGVQQIVPYDNSIIIEPIHIKDSFPEDPTYGRLEIEITNLSSYPLLINSGRIEFENVFGKIERSVYDILPNRNIREKPFEVPPKTHFVKTVLFDFESIDCITLHFDDEGILITKTYVNSIFEDVNGKTFKSEPKEFSIIAKGCILHKVKLLYKEFRKYLNKEKKVIFRAIELNQNGILKQLLSERYVDFSLLQQIYVLRNPDFPEYDICARMIQIANEVNNKYAIELMQMKGLPQDFVEFVHNCNKDL